MIFKCLNCGNCCSSKYVCIYYSELSKFKRVKNKANREFYLVPFRFYFDKTNKIIIDIIYRADSKPCPFLINNFCGIEEEKFLSCEKFPISTWIDLSFISKFGFKKLYYELDYNCTFLRMNKEFSKSGDNFKLENVFEREILANCEDHKLWTETSSKMKKIKKEKGFEIIIDYKFKKKEQNLFNLILNEWIHMPVDLYLETLQL